MPWLDDYLRDALADLRERNLDRRPQVIEEVDGPFVVIGGRRLLNFASNDYLGLGQHPAPAAPGGYGAGAARLLSGSRPEHAALEAELADLKGAEAALLLPTGYMANLALLPAIADAEAHIFSDAANHASLIDACRLSRARVTVYPHLDLATLDRELAASPSPRKLVVSETVFSMEGDLAPVADLDALARTHGAELVVDDAHGTGVFGEEGRGSTHLPQVATLSKAVGAAGGFVAGSRALIDLLVSRARTFLFTTAPPPAVAAAALARVRILRADHDRRERLWRNVRRLRPGAPSPILPVVLGGAADALAASRRLWEAGFFVPAVRPPTVPEGTARLRVSVSALHEPEHIDALANALRAL